LTCSTRLPIDAERNSTPTVKMSAGWTVHKKLADMLAVEPDATFDWNEFFKVRASFVTR